MPGFSGFFYWLASRAQERVMVNLLKSLRSAEAPQPNFQASPVVPDADELEQFFSRAIKINSVRSLYRKAVARFGPAATNKYISRRMDLTWRPLKDDPKRKRLSYVYTGQSQSDYQKVFCVYAAKHLSGAAARVAIYCLSWMNYNQGFRFFRSIEQIAEECGISEKTVRRAMDTLEKHGLISRTRASRRSRYTYRICPDEFFQKHDDLKLARPERKL
jgi:DNA-binding MarR family transcriptional regulator